MYPLLKVTRNTPKIGSLGGMMLYPGGGEDQVPEHWRVRNTPSFLLFLGPLSLGVVVLVCVSTTDRVVMFENYLYKKGYLKPCDCELISCWGKNTWYNITVCKQIIIIILSEEFFTPALADSISLEFEWQQVSSSLQKSSQYSGWSPQCCSLDGLHSPSYF